MEINTCLLPDRISCIKIFLEDILFESWKNILDDLVLFQALLNSLNCSRDILRVSNHNKLLFNWHRLILCIDINFVQFNLETIFRSSLFLLLVATTELSTFIPVNLSYFREDHIIFLFKLFLEIFAESSVSNTSNR